MKTIYYLHGYNTSGKKFKCIEEFYKNSTEYHPIYWEWNEEMDIPKFLQEKAKILSKDMGEKIIMADSMGANIAWHLVNAFPKLHYVMTNPVFSADQILDQTRILPEIRHKIFSATEENIKNKNIHLIISQFDKILDNQYYKKIFGDSLEVLELPDEHTIDRIPEFMPLIHKVVEKAFGG